MRTEGFRVRGETICVGDKNLEKSFPGGSVVKNPPAKQQTWVRSLGREDPLEEGMATHSSTLAKNVHGNPMDRGAWQATVGGVAESGTTEHART